MYKPKDIRRSCTIYTRYTDDSGKVRIFRRILTRCVFKDQGATIALKTGAAVSQQFFCMVFGQDDLEYIPIHEWRTTSIEELGGKWTADSSSSTPSFIVDHETTIDFPNWFANSSAATAAENAAFVNVLTAEPGSYKISFKPENHTVGVTGRSAHILIRV